MNEDAVPPDRRLAMVTAAAFVLTLAFLPLAHLLDKAMDRKRPMYNDVRTMDDLQYHQMKLTGEPLALTVQEDDTVEIGGRTFSPSDGVRLTLSVSDEGYCIQVTNRHCDATQWHCGDGKSGPN